MVSLVLLTEICGMKSVGRGGVKTRRPTKISQDVKEILEDAVKDELIITNEYNRFLMKWDGVIAKPVAKKIAKLMSTPDRVRSGSFSASGAGKCMRRQELQFLGVPVEGSIAPQQRRIFENGTWAHYRTQATLMTAGILDGIEVTAKRKKIRSRCTLDGVGEARSGRYSGADFGLEIKSANEWAYQHQFTKGATDGVRAQVDFQFLITGFDIMVILNENKNNQALKEWVLVRDQERVNRLAKRLQEMNGAIERQRLHPLLDECRKRNKTGEFYKCPFGGDGGPCASVGNWP
jgi:hypothetical protein